MNTNGNSRAESAVVLLHPTASRNVDQDVTSAESPHRRASSRPWLDPDEAADIECRVKGAIRLLEAGVPGPSCLPLLRSAARRLDRGIEVSA